MTLAQLVKDLPLAGVSGELSGVRIDGLACDSRSVEPGDLFVTWSGETFEGSEYAQQAVGSGAVAVLASREHPKPLGVPWLVSDDPRSLLEPLSLRLYGRPDQDLTLVGVTGTNGKTTVSQLIAGLLQSAGTTTGVLGTLGYRLGEFSFGSGRTTPEASDTRRLLRAMHDRGAQAASMEVSSHALTQGRVAGVEFDVAVFTNLSRDHLDYHASLEDYFQSKRRLFERLKPEGLAVVGTFDDFGRRLAGELDGAVTFGEAADYESLSMELGGHGTTGSFRTPSGTLRVESPLVGDFNVQNLLAAVAVCERLGLSQESIEDGLRETGPIPGRMEIVDAGQSFPVLVDYSHTPDALRAALESLRGFWPGKVCVVFGCGGDRDRGKRPLMGEVAGQLADLAIVTDDNPRTESPAAIHREVVEGLRRTRGAEYVVSPDRREAIRESVRVAGAEEGQWAVLIAGKGHEQTQTIGDYVVPFLDRREVAAALGDLLGSSKDD